MTTVQSSFDRVRPKMVAARVEFMSQLARFSKHELAQEPVPGEWSPLRLAHHLYIADGLVFEQLQRVQEENNPLIANLEEESPYLTRTSVPPVSLDAVLAGMAARREELFEYLSSLPADVWERPLRHHLWGEMKFYQLVNVLYTHDRQHTQQLAAIKR
jgi:DinB superfamily